MSNDLLVKIAVMGIVEKYCEDTETIEDVIRRYEEFSLKMDKTENYSTCIGKVTARIELLSNLLAMKKLKDNRDDLLALTTLLENEIQNLKIIATEVNN